jgi:hypothetical protein
MSSSRDVAVEAPAGADQVVDLAGGLDAAVAAADDDEGEIPAAFLRVVADLGLFQRGEDMGAQDDGVADGLQREGVVGHARHDVQVGDVAAGEDDVVVVELARLAVVALVFDPVAGQVHALDLLGAALKVAEREGFEPPEPCGSRAFQARAFDHSATSP